MFWANFLCRLCATIGTNSYPIFDETSNRNVDEKIKRCLKLHIFEDDLKPKVICECCYLKLNNLNDFIVLSEASNNKFDEILYQSERTALNGNWNEVNTTQQLVQEEALQNRAVNTDFLTIINYKEAENVSEFIESQNNLECKTVYEEPFESRDDNTTVLRHSSQFQNTKHTQVISAEPVQEQTEDFEYTTAEEAESLPEIQETNVEEPTTNQPVNNKNRSKENLISVDSIINIMKEKDNYKPTCLTKENKTAETPNKKRYTCEMCNNTYTRRFTLRTHVSRYHTNNKPFTCDTCSKTFVLQSELTTHKKLHGSEYKCEFCEKVFAAPSKLENHIRIHTNERIYRCPYENCDKSFTDKRNLVGHMVVHSDERNFICDICKKSFKSSNKLKDHMTAHRNPKFICNLCSKSYKWKQNLILHMRKCH